MKTLNRIGLAAAALGGVALTTAAPAFADDWRGHDHDRYERRWDGDQRDWRWRDRDDRPAWGYGYRDHRPYYAWRDRCASYWRWDDWSGRYVRVSRCY